MSSHRSFTHNWLFLYCCISTFTYFTSAEDRIQYPPLTSWSRESHWRPHFPLLLCSVVSLLCRATCPKVLLLGFLVAHEVIFFLSQALGFDSGIRDMWIHTDMRFLNISLQNSVCQHAAITASTLLERLSARFCHLAAGICRRPTGRALARSVLRSVPEVLAWGWGQGSTETGRESHYLRASLCNAET